MLSRVPLMAALRQLMKYLHPLLLFSKTEAACPGKEGQSDCWYGYVLVCVGVQNRPGYVWVCRTGPGV